MYLFFDCETNGFPRRWDAPANNLNNWPRLVQLAWLAYDIGGELQAKANYLKDYGSEIIC